MKVRKKSPIYPNKSRILSFNYKLVLIKLQAIDYFIKLPDIFTKKNRPHTLKRQGGVFDNFFEPIFIY